MINLARRVAAVRGSAIRDLLTLTARPEVISLAGGLPAADLLPRDRIAAAAARALAEPAAVQYAQTAGIAPLRETIAAHESARCARAVQQADVVVTSGSQQALDLVARALLDPGDAVVVEDPAYVGALQVFQAAGAELTGMPLDPDGMCVDMLADRLAGGLRPRLVHTVSSFHNPRGVTLAPERRLALAALADRYGFLVVEDDPYGLLAFDGRPARPVAAHGDRVLRLGSASKILAPALRVGWLTGPPVVTAAVERLKQGTDLCGSSLTQAIAAELLADTGWLDAHLTTARAVTAARARAFTAAVADLLPDVTCTTPTGGMFCWLGFPAGVDTTELLARALAAGVAFVPGAAFAVHADQTRAARCCYASVDEATLTEAVGRLAACVT
jgi:2-aminoadipate transaminase